MSTPQVHIDSAVKGLTLLAALPGGYKLKEEDALRKIDYSIWDLIAKIGDESPVAKKIMEI